MTFISLISHIYFLSKCKKCALNILKLSAFFHACKIHHLGKKKSFQNSITLSTEAKLLRLSMDVYVIFICASDRYKSYYLTESQGLCNHIHSEHLECQCKGNLVLAPYNRWQQCISCLRNKDLIFDC